MENQRPKLTDPTEFAIVREMYFKDGRKEWEELTADERLERMESRYRNKQKSSR